MLLSFLWQTLNDLLFLELQKWLVSNTPNNQIFGYEEHKLYSI